MFLSSQCVSVITLCLRHYIVFPSSQCVSVITVCFRNHNVFPSSQCVSVITVCFCLHSVFPWSQCVSVIQICFPHHSVFYRSLWRMYWTFLSLFPSSQCFLHYSVFPSTQCISVIPICFRHQRVFSSSKCVFVITLSFKVLYGVSNGRFRPCFLTIYPFFTLRSVWFYYFYPDGYKIYTSELLYFLIILYIFRIYLHIAYYLLFRNPQACFSYKRITSHSKLHIYPLSIF